MTKHKGECMVAGKYTEDPFVRLAIRFLIARRTLNDRASAALHELIRVRLPEDSRLRDVEVSQALEARFAARLPALGVSAQDILEALEMLQGNATTVDDDRTMTTIGNALFVTLSATNHSCCPNAIALFDNAGGLTLLSVRPLQAGEEITVSYVQVVLPRLLRRFQLSEGWAIDFCQCNACVDPKPSGELSLSPLMLFNSAAALGNVGATSLPLFQRYISGENDDGRDDETMQQLLLLLGSNPGLKKIEEVYQLYVVQRRFLSPGSYFWLAVVNFLAKSLLQASGTCTGKERDEIHVRAIAVYRQLCAGLETGCNNEISGVLCLPVLLRCWVWLSRLLLWRISYHMDGGKLTIALALEKDVDATITRMMELQRRLFGFVPAVLGVVFPLHQDAQETAASHLQMKSVLHGGAR
jgi:hypothetical protein